jgi:hypothetical protein
MEVVEYEPNRRAVTRQVSPIIGWQRAIQTVEPVNGGCVYTEVIESDLQPGQRMLREGELRWRSEVDERIARMRSILG